LHPIVESFKELEMRGFPPIAKLKVINRDNISTSFKSEKLEMTELYLISEAEATNYELTSLPMRVKLAGCTDKVTIQQIDPLPSSVLLVGRSIKPKFNMTGLPPVALKLEDTSKIYDFNHLKKERWVIRNTYCWCV
jgi:hypothetical protein